MPGENQDALSRKRGECWAGKVSGCPNLALGYAQSDGDQTLTGPRLHLWPLPALSPAPRESSSWATQGAPRIPAPSTPGLHLRSLDLSPRLFPQDGFKPFSLPVLPIGLLACPAVIRNPRAGPSAMVQTLLLAPAWAQKSIPPWVPGHVEACASGAGIRGADLLLWFRR